MAKQTHKLPENSPGLYYVDEQCIDCDLCRSVAPGNFKRQEQRGYSFVFKQPGTEEEIRQSRQALSECPVEAIGCDGEPVHSEELIVRNSKCI